MGGWAHGQGRARGRGAVHDQNTAGRAWYGPYNDHDFVIITSFYNVIMTDYNILSILISRLLPEPARGANDDVRPLGEEPLLRGGRGGGARERERERKKREKGITRGI